MDTTATTSSLLDTDKTNGLQLAVKSCPVAWTETVTNGAATYTCSGGAGTTIANSGPAVGATTLNNLTSLTAGGTDHLVVTLSLPTSADNTFQGKTSALAVSFTGTQQTGTAR